MKQILGVLRSWCSEDKKELLDIKNESSGHLKIQHGFEDRDEETSQWGRYGR